MLKKIGLVAVLAALISVVVATTTAWGSAKAPRTASAATASVKCGKTRTIGMAAPITGPASDIGNQQVRWAKYFVKRWNKKHSNARIKMVMGLAPILVERNFEIIQQVHESGVAILVVEQNANVSLAIADRGYVLSTGRVVLSGAAAELREHEDLRKAYLGR